MARKKDPEGSKAKWDKKNPRTKAGETMSAGSFRTVTVTWDNAVEGAKVRNFTLKKGKWIRSLSREGDKLYKKAIATPMVAGKKELPDQPKHFVAVTGANGKTVQEELKVTKVESAYETYNYRIEADKVFRRKQDFEFEKQRLKDYMLMHYILSGTPETERGLEYDVNNAVEKFSTSEVYEALNIEEFNRFAEEDLKAKGFSPSTARKVSYDRKKKSDLAQYNEMTIKEETGQLSTGTVQEAADKMTLEVILAGKVKAMGYDDVLSQVLSKAQLYDETPIAERGSVFSKDELSIFGIINSNHLRISHLTGKLGEDSWEGQLDALNEVSEEDGERSTTGMLNVVEYEDEYEDDTDDRIRKYRDKNPMRGDNKLALRGVAAIFGHFNRGASQQFTNDPRRSTDVIPIRGPVATDEFMQFDYSLYTKGDLPSYQQISSIDFLQGVRKREEGIDGWMDYSEDDFKSQQYYSMGLHENSSIDEYFNAVARMYVQEGHEDMVPKVARYLAHTMPPQFKNVGAHNAMLIGEFEEAFKSGVKAGDLSGVKPTAPISYTEALPSMIDMRAKFGEGIKFPLNKEGHPSEIYGGEEHVVSSLLGFGVTSVRYGKEGVDQIESNSQKLIMRAAINRITREAANVYGVGMDKVPDQAGMVWNKPIADITQKSLEEMMEEGSISPEDWRDYGFNEDELRKTFDNYFRPSGMIGTDAGETLDGSGRPVYKSMMEEFQDEFFRSQLNFGKTFGSNENFSAPNPNRVSGYDEFTGNWEDRAGDYIPDYPMFTPDDYGEQHSRTMDERIEELIEQWVHNTGVADNELIRTPQQKANTLEDWWNTNTANMSEEDKMALLMAMPMEFEEEEEEVVNTTGASGSSGSVGGSDRGGMSGEGGGFANARPAMDEPNLAGTNSEIAAAHSQTNVNVNDRASEGTTRGAAPTIIKPAHIGYDGNMGSDLVGKAGSFSTGLGLGRNIDPLAAYLAANPQLTRGAEQGTKQWHEDRQWTPTSSVISSWIGNNRGVKGLGPISDEKLNNTIGKRLSDITSNKFQAMNEHMQRGVDMEDPIADAYMKSKFSGTGITAMKMPMLTNSQFPGGTSIDRLLVDKAGRPMREGLEIKSTAEFQDFKNYYHQAQHQMHVGNLDQMTVVQGTYNQKKELELRDHTFKRDPTWGLRAAKDIQRGVEGLGQFKGKPLKEIEAMLAEGGETPYILSKKHGAMVEREDDAKAAKGVGGTTGASGGSGGGGGKSSASKNGGAATPKRKSKGASVAGLVGDVVDTLQSGINIAAKGTDRFIGAAYDIGMDPTTYTTNSIMMAAGGMTQSQSSGAMSTISLMAGGMESGNFDSAKRLVAAMRGLVTFEDVMQHSNDPAALVSIIRAKNNGQYSERALASMMLSGGLDSSLLRLGHSGDTQHSVLALAQGSKFLTDRDNLGGMAAVYGADIYDNFNTGGPNANIFSSVSKTLGMSPENIEKREAEAKANTDKVNGALKDLSNLPQSAENSLTKSLVDLTKDMNYGLGHSPKQLPKDNNYNPAWEHNPELEKKERGYKSEYDKSAEDWEKAQGRPQASNNKDVNVLVTIDGSNINFVGNRGDKTVAAAIKPDGALGTV